MIHYICPVCKTENKHTLNFRIEEYVCSSCSNLIDVRKNESKKVLKKPTENVVLDTNSKGIIDGVEYFVTGIVVRKYGSSTFWREYYLKDKNNNDAFLSESDGHWVMLFPKEKPLEDFKWYADFEGKKYRWYESTPSNIDAAAGFFEERLNFKLANYKEFVNGTEMVSIEGDGKIRSFFWGKHIPKSKIEKAFKPDYMPFYSGIGIVQPFYFNVRQMVNIFAISALLISLVQLYNTVFRDNYEVFNESVRFDAVRGKELISKSFELKGASAPLKVKLFSDVDNSWANVEVSLVNEKTNEIEYTSKDIEQYHGYEGGESWKEGSKNENFNFCGVASGKYHFRISGQKQGYEEPTGEIFYSPDKTKSYLLSGDGFVDVTDLSTSDKTSYNLENLQINNPQIYSELEAAKEFKKNNPDFSATLPDTDTFNPDFTVKAYWQPVSFWNYFIILGIMAVLTIAGYWWKYIFDKSKWENSNNSPYAD
ncbi:MAG: DUF4178 domain-containing protein [Bergeyella sp.]